MTLQFALGPKESAPIRRSFQVMIQEPPRGYSIAELHAYARSRDYQDEADALRRYLKLRKHEARNENQGPAPGPRADAGR